MKEHLEKLFSGHLLTELEARDLMRTIAEGRIPHTQTASFLTVFRMRPVSAVELHGFRLGLLDLASKLDLSEFQPIDVCGTGGDGKNTFNISTAAAFVLAGAGEKVAKHGNKSVSSRCGSSDVLQELGVKFSADPDTLRRQIDRSGFCYLHAPLFHPAMKNVAPVRQELGVRTVFNLLGPLVNPSRPDRQLTGVYGMDVARVYADVFRLSEGMQYAVIYSWDGFDEISLTGPWSEIYGSGEQRLQPADLGLEPLSPEQLCGGESVREGAELLLSVLKGEASTAAKSVVAANAAAALRVSQPEKGAQQAFADACEVIDSGRAYRAFSTYLELAGS